MTKLSTLPCLVSWALSVTFLSLLAAPLARADGFIDPDYTTCEPCNSSREGNGNVGASAAIASRCTISGAVSSSAVAAGMWAIEYYYVNASTYVDDVSVGSGASVYGFTYGFYESSYGNADCDGNDTGSTADVDNYDYGGAETASEYS